MRDVIIEETDFGSKQSQLPDFFCLAFEFRHNNSGEISNYFEIISEDDE